MEITYIEVDKIIPYARNYNEHPDKQVTDVAASIKEFDFDQPITVDKNGVIITGHCRLLAGKKAGLKSLPCIIRNDLTPTQVKAKRLADNILARKAIANQDLLKLEIEDLKLEEFDLTLTGIDDDELAKLLAGETGTEGKTDDDAVPEVSEPICKSGQLWKLGEHRLLCGDCTDAANVDRLMGGEKADMVFTDPPYGMNLDADYSGMVNRDGVAGKKHKKIEGDGGDFCPKHIFEFFSCEEVFLFGADYYAEAIPEKNKGRNS